MREFSKGGSQRAARREEPRPAVIETVKATATRGGGGAPRAAVRRDHGGREVFSKWNFLGDWFASQASRAERKTQRSATEGERRGSPCEDFGGSKELAGNSDCHRLPLLHGLFHDRSQALSRFTYELVSQNFRFEITASIGATTLAPICPHVSKWALLCDCLFKYWIILINKSPQAAERARRSGGAARAPCSAVDGFGVSLLFDFGILDRTDPRQSRRPRRQKPPFLPAVFV